MAKSIATGFTRTPIAGVTDPTKTIPLQNWSADFAVVTDVLGECVVTDLTAPLPQETTVRISQRDVANVYSRVSVEPAAMLALKTGTETLFERREMWLETDSADSTYQKLTPVRVGITIAIPKGATAITNSMVIDAVLRTVAGLYDTSGTSVVDVVSPVLHGVLRKKTL